MADIDVSQLTADQQSALDQYIAVTAQETKDAIPLLQRCQWNVQVCKSETVVAGAKTHINRLR